MVASLLMVAWGFVSEGYVDSVSLSADINTMFKSSNVERPYRLIPRRTYFPHGSVLGEPDDDMNHCPRALNRDRG